MSAHGVGVSTTSDELNNTGVRYDLGKFINTKFINLIYFFLFFVKGSIITINNLLPNESYCFAAAAFNADEKISEGIGNTGENITTVHPLPINLLFSYLAKTAY